MFVMFCLVVLVVGAFGVRKAIRSLDGKDQPLLPAPSMLETIPELRRLKKQLELRKREINIALRHVRSTARTKRTAIAGEVSLASIFLGSSWKQAKRVGVRAGQEAQLVPLENEKIRIEFEIMDIERRILELQHSGT